MSEQIFYGKGVPQMTPAKLEELEKLARAADQGEWSYTENDSDNTVPEHSYGVIASLFDTDDGDQGFYIADGASPKNGPFIAAANPQTILALIEEVRGLREALKNCARHCLCSRFKTPGFDYGETHKRLGKPMPGSRWLTPGDLIFFALNPKEARGRIKV